MFTLKEHTRRNVRLATLSAAVASMGLIADVSHAATIYWDPSHTATTSGPSGGAGTLDNTVVNFDNANGIGTDVAAATTADTDFGGTAGAVNIDAATSLNSLTIDAGTSGNYTFSGSNLTLGPVNTNFTVLSNLAGNNTFSGTVITGTGSSSLSTNLINVAASTTLTIGTLMGPSGNSTTIGKSGTGTLAVGTLNFAGHILDVRAGTLAISNDSFASGSGNIVNALNLETGATITGSAGSAGVANLQVTGTGTTINGHVAPGVNTSGNFGGVGSFNLHGDIGSGPANAVTFGGTANLDLDLTSLSSYDTVNLTSGTYGSTMFVTIASGATVNINNGTGTLIPGTYHILTLTIGAKSSGAAPLSITDSTTANGVGFVIGSAPSGYKYTFTNVGTSPGKTPEGIDLTIAAAPTTTATTFTLASTSGSANVLLNGKTSTTSTITNSGSGTADTLNFTGLGLSATGGTITGSTTSGGPLAQGASSTPNSGQIFQGTSNGSSVLTPVTASATNATLTGNATNNGTQTTTINVGNATANNTNSTSTFGTALTANITASGDYTNLSSTVTGVSGSGGAGTLHSTATILNGVMGSSGPSTVSMAWRTRTTSEVSAAPFTGPGPGLWSDVVGVSDPNNDVYVLQMTFDPTQAAAGSVPELGFLSGSTWVNAGSGTEMGVYNGTDVTVGDFGVNFSNDTVWAVVNHGGEFAAVPEPASLALLGLGALALISRRRRKD